MKKIFVISLFFLLITLATNSQMVEYYHTAGVDAGYRYGGINTHKAILSLDMSLVKTAEVEVLETIKKYPDVPTTDLNVFLKADIDLKNGNYHIALKELEIFVNERNNSPFVSSALLFSGYINLEAKHYDEAEKYFILTKSSANNDKHIRTDKPHYEYIEHCATYWLAISLCQQGKYLDAIPHFAETQKSFPNLKYAAQSLYALGSIAEMDKNYEKAIGYYEQIEMDYPYSNVIIASLVRNANDRLLLRNPQAALLYIQRAENGYRRIATGDSVGLLYEKQDFNDNYLENIEYLQGEAYNQIEQYDQAIKNFNEVVTSYPKSELMDFVNMGIGWAYLNKTEYENAIEYFQKVIDSRLNYSHSGNISNVKAIAYLNKISALKKLKRIDEAQAELSLLAVRPNFPQLAYVQLELSQIYYEKGDYEQARKTLERAEREAENPKVLIRITSLLGASYMELKQYNKASESYQKTFELAEKADSLLIPNKKWYLIDALLKQGIALVFAQRSNEAITPLLKYISFATNTSNNKLAEALFWLAEAYYRCDMLKNSADNFEKVINNHPTTKRREEALYGLGWSYFRLENFNRSSSIFDQLVKEFPSSGYATEVLTRQADGYYRIKNYAGASEYYSRAAKQGPNTEEGQYSAYQLAHTLYRQNKYEQSVTASLNFVKNYPKSNLAPNALYLIAWIRFQQEKYAESIDNFQFLIKTYPQTKLVARSYFAIADCYYNMENYDQAIEGYKTVVEQFPSDDLAPEAVKSIQTTLQILDRDGEAFEIVDTYISTNPNSPFVEDFRYKRAEMFYSGRKFNDAISEFENFANKYPESGKTAEALYWLGKSYSASNDFDNASKTYLKLKTDFPQNDYAAAGLLEYGFLLKQNNMIDSAHNIFRTIEDDFAKSDVAPQSGFERAILFWGVGDTVRAMTQFKAVADKYPDTDYGDQSRYRVAMYYRFLGMNIEAIREFSVIAEVYDSPDIAAEARFRIGELYLKMDDIKNAQLCFEILRDKFAGYEDWYSLGLINLGEIYERQGNIDEAKELYTIIQLTRPDDEFGKTAAQRLKRIK